MTVYEEIIKSFKVGKKQFALLIDTDDVVEENLAVLVDKINSCGLDFVFVGGSLLLKNNFENIIKRLRANCNVPIVIFPGHMMQLTEEADAILFLTLISGRNPEYLIGQQVVAAPQIKALNIEPISTGYILVDSGSQTSVSYMSNTTPVPRDKKEICMSTALAGEMLGQKLIYLDGGSGAKYPVPIDMIKFVKQNLSIPLIVGGGLDKPEKVSAACAAGADIVVVGNAVERDISVLSELVMATKVNISENHCNF